MNRIDKNTQFNCPIIWLTNDSWVRFYRTSYKNAYLPFLGTIKGFRYDAMADRARQKWRLKKLINKADSSVEEINCCPFSRKAKALLRRKIRNYIIKLISNSTKLAKDQQADTVSGIHVEKASSYLIYDSGKRCYKHIGTVGGIILGASISALLSTLALGHYSNVTILVTTILCIIGGSMVAFHIAKDSQWTISFEGIKGYGT